MASSLIPVLAVAACGPGAPPDVVTDGEHEGFRRVRPPAPRPRRYRQVIAVDGKTLRSARRADGRQVHLLSALDTGTGIVLAQVNVEAKSNEIPAFTPLIDAVATVLGSLRGVVFLADALHAQTGHAHQITARGAHFATLRNTAIGYHRTNGQSNIARATRRANRRPHELIEAVTSRNPTTQ